MLDTEIPSLLFSFQSETAHQSRQCLCRSSCQCHLNNNDEEEVFTVVAESMEPGSRKFGSGPRELGGALDLISQYKLWPHHEFFCKRLPPLSSLQTCYLHNVVGNTEIKKGEGMELDQLVRTKTNCKEKCTHFSTFELDTLSEAFQMRDSTPIDLPSVEKGGPPLKSRHRGKDRKHKKHRETKKGKVNEENKHKTGHNVSAPMHSRNQQDLKRRHDVNGDHLAIRKQ